jgi:hypothetical protein
MEKKFKTNTERTATVKKRRFMKYIKEGKCIDICE